MKTKLIIFTFVILLVSGCVGKANRKTSAIENTDSKNIKDSTIADKPEPYVFYLTDTTDKSKAYVKLTVAENNCLYVVDWGVGNLNWRKSLFEITNKRGYKCPPSIMWTNSDYICLMTNHSGAFSEHVFLPFREDLKIHFFKEDIEYMDSVNNFIIFIDPENDFYNKSTWTIQSLVTDVKESFEISIYENSCCYPWYENIERKGNFIIIKPQGDTKKLIRKNIKKYCT